jgi:DNA repair photolyase
MHVQEIACRTILNPTSGFLAEAYTHTINLYRGCALGNSLCGTFCYAQHNRYHTLGREWGSFLDVKAGFVEAYGRDYDRLKRPRCGEPQALRIYMSSVTDPYPPQERRARRTRGLLEAMVARSPDVLVIQSHTPLVVEDLGLLVELNSRCALQVNITVETDGDLPGFRRHAYPPRARIAALSTLRAAGVRSVGVVSPLLPLGDPYRFARELETACEYVILDHYLLGDGSPGAFRTNRTDLPRILQAGGWERWKTLDAFEDVVSIFRQAFGAERVGISRSGFNTLPAAQGRPA